MSFIIQLKLSKQKIKLLQTELTSQSVRQKNCRENPTVSFAREDRRN